MKHLIALGLLSGLVLSGCQQAQTQSSQVATVSEYGASSRQQARLERRSCNKADLIGEMTLYKVHHTLPNEEYGGSLIYPYQAFLFTEKGMSGYITSTEPLDESSMDQLYVNAYEPYQIDDRNGYIYIESKEFGPYGMLCNYITSDQYDEQDQLLVREGDIMMALLFAEKDRGVMRFFHRK